MAESFSQFMEGRVASSKPEAIVELVRAIQDVFKKYNLDTRKLAWKKLISEKGQKQLDRLLRSPTAPISMSEFVKLVQER